MPHTSSLQEIVIGTACAVLVILSFLLYKTGFALPDSNDSDGLAKVTPALPSAGSEGELLPKADVKVAASEEDGQGSEEGEVDETYQLDGMESLG